PVGGGEGHGRSPVGGGPVDQRARGGRGTKRLQSGWAARRPALPRGRGRETTGIAAAAAAPPPPPAGEGRGGGTPQHPRKKRNGARRRRSRHDPRCAGPTARPPAPR